MKKLVPIISVAILLVACGDNGDSNSSTVAINKVEKSITKNKTSVGCRKRGNNSPKECKEEGNGIGNSAQFILSTLEQESDENGKGEDIASIKEDLKESIKKLTEEENKRDKIKENLIALVGEVDKKKVSKRKRLQDFIDNLDDSELGVSKRSRVDEIRRELRDLIGLEESSIKSKDVKKRLESLIQDVTESKKGLTQTERSLKRLVKDVEKQNTPSAKKFASAIIRDVSAKKISIVKETRKYFVIKVQRGDNLSILAKRYYNDKNKYRVIYEANKNKINSNYEIFEGATLLIPKI
jgi:uncharacterized coiled-coil protein SlyX